MFPEETFKGYPKPDIPKHVDHYHTWVDHVLKGERTSDGFHYAGPLAEAVLLGTIGHRMSGKKFTWDAKAMKTNDPEANKLLKRDWRKFG